MRIVSIGLIAAALLCAAPAQAQVLDLSTIKCKEFIESGKETIGLVLMWLDGYYTGEDDPAVVDFGKLAKNGEKIGEYCAKNPTIGVGTAAEELFGK